MLFHRHSKNIVFLHASFLCTNFPFFHALLDFLLLITKMTTKGRTPVFLFIDELFWWIIRWHHLTLLLQFRNSVVSSFFFPLIDHLQPFLQELDAVLFFSKLLQLKELEKLGPRKGVITQSVKDVVQSLVDDDLVSKDKIGTSVSKHFRRFFQWKLHFCK